MKVIGTGIWLDVDNFSFRVLSLCYLWVRKYGQHLLTTPFVSHLTSLLHGRNGQPSISLSVIPAPALHGTGGDDLEYYFSPVTQPWIPREHEATSHLPGRSPLFSTCGSPSPPFGSPPRPHFPINFYQSLQEDLAHCCGIAEGRWWSLMHEVALEPGAQLAAQLAAQQLAAIRPGRRRLA